MYCPFEAAFQRRSVFGGMFGATAARRAGFHTCRMPLITRRSSAKAYLAYLPGDSTQAVQTAPRSAKADDRPFKGSFLNP
jgi:hypothetical protein